MKISNINSYHPVSTQGNGKIKKYIAAGVAALAITNPVASNSAHAKDCPTQSYYGMAIPSDWSMSDFERAYAAYGDNYAIEFLQDEDIGFYYSYAGKTYNLDGDEIKIQNKNTYPVFKPSSQISFPPNTDYDRLHSMFGNSCQVETHYDKNIGKYYTYGGIALDKNGTIITGYFDRDAEDYWASVWNNPHLTDLMKMFALYADHYKVEEHYDRNFGTYYKYAGRYYAPNGSEIINSQVLHDDKKGTSRPNIKVTDIMKMYAIYGDKYEVIEHWDKNYGLYYSYAGKYYNPDGSEIKYSNKSNSSNSSDNTNNIPSRVKYGTDFYYYYLQFGDGYKIKAHWDPNVGSYYQYGPFAFTQDGKQIINTSDLHGFDKKVK